MERPPALFKGALTDKENMGGLQHRLARAEIPPVLGELKTLSIHQARQLFLRGRGVVRGKKRLNAVDTHDPEPCAPGVMVGVLYQALKPAADAVRILQQGACVEESTRHAGL